MSLISVSLNIWTLTHSSGSISSMNAPRLVLTARDQNESASGGVWRGYLDCPSQSSPLGVVAKFGKLDSLCDEAFMYAKIKKYGGITGVPDLIGLYKIDDLSTWGVVILNDCGTSLAEGPPVTDEERWSILHYTFISYLLIHF